MFRLTASCDALLVFYKQAAKEETGVFAATIKKKRLIIDAQVAEDWLNESADTKSSDTRGCLYLYYLRMILLQALFFFLNDSLIFKIQQVFGLFCLI